MTVGLCLLAILSVVGDATERTIVQFGSRGCPACRTIQPLMEKLQAEGWAIRYIDTERDPLTAERFHVLQLPTLIVVERGSEVDRIVGSLPDAQLRRRLTGGDELAANVPSSSPPVNRNSSGPSRYSMLGPNHPFSRAKPASSTLSNGQRRSRIADSAGDVKEALIGINHPFYSRYHQPQPDSIHAASRQIAATNSARQPPVPVETHSLTEGLVALPAFPESMAATVRIQVAYADSKSVGTGTIVHTTDDGAWVLTCAHLFRDRQVTAPVSVELFQGKSIVRIPASVIDICRDEVDLALIRFRSSTPVSKVSILPKGEKLHERTPVFSIGCDLGSEPSRRDSVISKLNRYLGTSNVEIAGAPVQGRSGGGLFDEHGRLVGVCYAADNVLDEGLFIGPEAIHAQLEKFRP